MLLFKGVLNRGDFMGFLSRYDWIQPTNPYAAVFFGIIFTIIIACVVWLDAKEIKTTVITFLTGLGITIIGVLILRLIGFYG